MSRQITHYSRYQVRTDGSLYPAAIAVTNYLIRHYGHVALDILVKHGMQELVDYRRDDSDDYERFILLVRPEAYSRIREVLVELSNKSKEVYARDCIEEAKRDKIYMDAMEEFNRVFAEIDKEIGEDVV